MRIARKIKNTDGFSLAELLVATLILLMVSTVVAGGIPVARDAYNKVTVEANAQVLLSNAVHSLRNKLGTASDVTADTSSSTLEYVNASTGMTEKIYKETSGECMIQKVVDSTYGYVDAEDMTEALVSDSDNSDLYVTYETIAYKDGIVTVTDLMVKSTSDSASDESRAELDTLNIRVIRGS